MRTLIASMLMTLDGVTQDPGGFGEADFGGWAQRYFDDEAAAAALEQLNEADLWLVGAGTFGTLYRAWHHNSGPYPDRLHVMDKCVVSSTLTDPLPWNARVLPGDPAATVGALKAEPGGTIVMYGTGRFFQTLVAHDLIDEYHMSIFPLVLGRGRRPFEEGQPTGLDVTGLSRSAAGVVNVVYRRGATNGVPR